MYLNAEDYRQQKAKTREVQAREELIHRILFCRSREEVIEARAAKDAWIVLHPDDDEVFEASECLEVFADGYGLIE